MGISPFSHVCAEYRRQRTRTPANSPTPCHWEIITFSVAAAKSLSSQSLEEREAGSVGLKETLPRFRGLQKSPAYWLVLREPELWWWPMLGYQWAGPHSYSYRGDGKELRTCLHGFLLIAVETPRHQSSLRIFQRAAVSLRHGLCTTEDLPCFCNSWATAQGAVGGRAKEALWQREEEWLGSAELLWHERRDVEWEIGVAPSPRDMLAGRGEWGKRPPTAFASSISLTLREGRAVEDTRRFRELHGVMRREAAANLPHLPYLHHQRICADLRSTGDSDERPGCPESTLTLSRPLGEYSTEGTQ